MALKIRRGTDASRLTITPSEGELVYTTDTKKIFVGDGSTLGGTEVSGVNEGMANSIAYYEQDGKEVSTTHNLKWNDISNILLVDRGSLAISNELASRTMLTISQNYNSAAGSNLVFARSRGSITSPVPNQINDVLGNVNFNTYNEGAAGYTTSAGVTGYLPVIPTAKGTPFTVNFVSKTGTGPYYVTFSFVTQSTAPAVSRAYTIEGNSNEAYNGTFRVNASTTSSMTLFFNSDPGAFGSGTTTAYMEPINPGTLTLLTQSSNGNLFRTVKVQPDGLVVIGALPLDYTPFGQPQSRPHDPTFSGQLAINSNATNSNQTSALAQLTLRTYADTTYGQSINLYRFRGTQISAAAVQNGDQIFITKYAGADGPSGAGIAATINVTVDGAVSTGKVPGAITFSTANVSSGTLTPVLKIDSSQKSTFSGNVQVDGTISTTKTPATFWNYDTTASTISMTLGQTINFSNFSGSVLVNCYNSGAVTQWLCGGGGTPNAVGSSKNSPTGTMQYSSGISGYTFTSTEAGVHSFYVIRTRTGA